MTLNNCCFVLSLKNGSLLILTIDGLYGLLFAIVSLARLSDFSVTLGAAGVVWFMAILHLIYFCVACIGISIVIKNQVLPWLGRAYWISAGVLGCFQLIMFVLAGVYRQATVSDCAAKQGRTTEGCATAILVAYFFLGACFVIWTSLQIYFCLVIQAYLLKTKGRQRYSALKDQFIRDWDAQMEAKGSVSRINTVKSEYDV
ncbi:hypothetical protein CLU79DRAFT_838259 [Phycomyces nitens]|nr:hypothetical protein CLU79DRAFT_838259 [Phycomyces nitens]